MKMTALKNAPFKKVMERSFHYSRRDRSCRDIICNFCESRFGTMEDFINHLLREHADDPLPEKKKRGKNTACPFLGFQGLTGLDGLQPTCEYGGTVCHCPVIDMNTGEKINCVDLDENQMKAAKNAKRRLGWLYR